MIEASLSSVTCSVANTLESCREVDGLSDGHLGDMEVILIDVSCRLLWNEVTQLHTIVLDFSCDLEIGVELPCKSLEEGGLAAARGSQEKRQLGRLDDAADTIEDADPGMLAVEAQHAAHRLMMDRSTYNKHQKQFALMICCSSCSRGSESDTHREVGDGGVPDGGERLPLHHLAFRLHADVVPAHLHRGRADADPVHPLALLAEQAEVVTVDVGDEGVHHHAPLRRTQPAHVHHLQFQSMEQEQCVDIESRQHTRMR